MITNINNIRVNSYDTTGLLAADLCKQDKGQKNIFTVNTEVKVKCIQIRKR